MIDRPLSSFTLKFLGMVHEHACYFCILGIFGFGCAEKGLKGEKGGFDGQNGGPGGA